VGSVGVGAEPFGGKTLTHIGSRHGPELVYVVDLASVDVVGDVYVGEGVVFGVFAGVPAPVRHGAEGDTAFVKGGKGLKTGGIDGEGEFAVTNGEAVEAVDDGVFDVMAGYQGLAVDRVRRGFAARLQADQDKDQEQGKLMLHSQVYEKGYG